MNREINLETVKKVHFIGIGGIGISAIARMFKGEGKEISGSDRGESKVTEELEQVGIKVFLEQRADNVPDDVDLIVYTLAIPADNPEFMRAKELGVPMLSYPEALGLVSSTKYTIAVSGTHGKTTTTAMLARIFREAKLEPTVVVGSIIPELYSNFVAGKGKYFIAEACEYKRSFLNLNPQAVIITNIDTDHLDYYKDLADIQSAFAELVSKIPTDGYLICDPNDERLAPVLAVAKCQVVDYLVSAKSEEIKLLIPGKHNIKDAQAALALAVTLGVDKPMALEALSHFTGTWRRYEVKGLSPNHVMIYDDYAHHPTEIKATLQGTRESYGPNSNITVVFQPHLFSRTKLLLDDFANSFDDTNTVIVTDIYAAREIDDGTISSRDLVERLKEKNIDARYISDFAEIEQVLKEIVEKGKPGDIVITMGAGEAFQIGENLITHNGYLPG